jgi:hypothetical protein
MWLNSSTTRPVNLRDGDDPPEHSALLAEPRDSPGVKVDRLGLTTTRPGEPLDWARLHPHPRHEGTKKARDDAHQPVRERHFVPGEFLG